MSIACASALKVSWEQCCCLKQQLQENVGQNGNPVGGKIAKQRESFFVRDVEEQCGPEKRKRGIVTKETFGQANHMRYGKTGRKMGEKTNENSKEGIMREKGLFLLSSFKQSALYL